MPRQGSKALSDGGNAPRKKLVVGVSPGGDAGGDLDGTGIRRRVRRTASGSELDPDSVMAMRSLGALRAQTPAAVYPMKPFITMKDEARLEDEKKRRAAIRKVRERFTHKLRPSLFSSEAPPLANYTGMRNLGLLLLVSTNLRLIIENILKYGLRFEWATFARVLPGFRDGDAAAAGDGDGDGLGWTLEAIIARFAHMPLAFAFSSMTLMFAIGVEIERAMGKRRIKPFLGMTLHYINLAAMLFVPSAIVWTGDINVGIGIFILLGASTMFMKLVSYVAINAEERIKLAKRARIARKIGSPPPVPSVFEDDEKEGSSSSDKDHTYRLVTYPNNISHYDSTYFILAPTLNYQLNYPRTDRVRWWYVARRVLELCLYSVVLVVMAIQYIVPTVENAMVPLSEMDMPRIVERILKLSIPNMYLWLLGFYMIFHVYFNFWAEILQFGDRMFYSDWWNATTIDAFWRTWNLPVHQWLGRHVYLPVVARGYSRNVASIACFFVSALFHELVISVSIGSVGIFGFAAMMSQIPLVFITRKFFSNKPVGNIILWISLLFGQPLGIIIYYQDWYIKSRLAAGEA